MRPRRRLVNPREETTRCAPSFAHFSLKGFISSLLSKLLFPLDLRSLPNMCVSCFRSAALSRQFHPPSNATCITYLLLNIIDHLSFLTHLPDTPGYTCPSAYLRNGHSSHHWQGSVYSLSTSHPFTPHPICLWLQLHDSPRSSRSVGPCGLKGETTKVVWEDCGG